MYCASCGERLVPPAKFCVSCGAATAATPAASAAPPERPIFSAEMTAGGLPEDTTFGGFWIRAFAVTIDCVLGMAVALVASVPAGVGMAGLMMASGAMVQAPNTRDVNQLIGTLITLVVFWLYFTVAESSSWQATPGKRLLGLKVVDERGERVSFMRANARYWLKIVSWLPFFAGFIMAGVTAQKQGLHDKLAGTWITKS